MLTGKLGFELDLARTSTLQLSPGLSYAVNKSEGKICIGNTVGEMR